MLVARRKRPARVTRGSSVTLNNGPFAPFIAAGDRAQLLCGVHDHRAELEHLESAAAETDALLPEQHRATVAELDGNRGAHEHGERQHQQHARDHGIEHTFRGGLKPGG